MTYSCHGSVISGSRLSLKMHVFGPETHMTAIVSMAFGLRPIPQDRLAEPQSSSLMRNVRRNDKACLCVLCIRLSIVLIYLLTP